MAENQPKEVLDGQTVWPAQKRRNYGGKHKAGETVIACYTVRQMKSLYPNGGYQIAAEYAGKTRGETTGTLCCEKLTLPVSKYGSNSRLKYRESGYIAVEPGEDCYVAVLGDVRLRRILALILCLVILAGGITAAVLASRTPGIVPAAEFSSAAAAPELESGAVDWEGIKVSEPEDAPADGIRIPGFKSITVEADTAEVSVNLQNPEQNNCFFVIRLVLVDTQETLYESKMIEPGKGLYHITLSRALAAGTYQAKLQYEPYDMTTLTRLNGAEINLELIAE